MDSQVVAIQVWPLQVPLRRPFRHAAAERTVADPLVVEVELAKGTIGFGETLPRPYVTGETAATVQSALRTVLLEPLVDARPESMSAALELAESLPWQDRDGQGCPAARAALELALLDAYSKFFRRDLVQMAGWFGVAGYGPPGSARRVRYGLVLGSDEPSKLHQQVRLARVCGIRDFKLKMGDADAGRDRARLDAVMGILSTGLRSRKVTLRIDANGAWQPDAARQFLAGLKGRPIAAVEQPTPRGTEQTWPQIHQACALPIMADESLVAMQDAERLVQGQAVQALNVRISKNGGLTAAVRLAEFARRHKLGLMVGCMVGETAILSAAQVKLLQIVDNAAFAEGCYGRLLLRDDVGKRVQFGYGGRVPRVGPMSLGMRVDRDRLASLCPEGPMRLSP
jgi:L-alanine-DL-glutamate epimerase-like enolase superfamily enzyme